MGRAVLAGSLVSCIKGGQCIIVRVTVGVSLLLVSAAFDFGIVRMF